MKPVICALAVTLLALQAACAQEPYGSHHHPPSIEQLARELDLSGTQKTQVERILDSERSAREQLRDSSAELSPESRREQMRALQSELIQRLSTVLTPEQLQKFEQLEQRRRHHGHSFGYGQASSEP